MPAYGIIGNPVSQSLSPVLHGAIYRMTGYDGTYGRFPVEREGVAGVVPAMKTLGISGVNVTIPYKREIMPYLDELSEDAREIGAVNTVQIREDGVAAGYNTDYYGFARSLVDAGIEIAGRRFAVCGSGGSGKAVAFALKKHGAAGITVVSRNSENGVSYAELGKLGDMDAIINCTPLGMGARSGESPAGPEALARFKSAVDLIYNPEETLFLKNARLKGLKTLNGLPMLVYQGIRSFEIWTGISPPENAAEEIIRELARILRDKKIYRGEGLLK